MKIAALVLALLWLDACSRGQAAVLYPRPEPGRQEFLLTEEEMTSVPDPVPEREAEQVAAASFPDEKTECGPGVTKAWVKSSIRGSFTAPGTAQVMYFVRSYECDGLPSRHRDEVVVYQGGREVWRSPGDEPVRAVDADGDGKDEWVEVLGRCDPECAAEARMYGFEAGRAVEIARGLKD